MWGHLSVLLQMAYSHIWSSEWMHNIGGPLTTEEITKPRIAIFFSEAWNPE